MIARGVEGLPQGIELFLCSLLGCRHHSIVTRLGHAKDDPIELALFTFFPFRVIKGSLSSSKSSSDQLPPRSAAALESPPSACRFDAMRLTDSKDYLGNRPRR